jgi:hypothetical protein
VKAAREAWFERQLDLDPERLIFIDETSASTNMGRLYGRAGSKRRALSCRDSCATHDRPSIRARWPKVRLFPTDHGNYLAALKMIKMQGGVFGAVTDSAAFIKAIG